MSANVEAPPESQASSGFVDRATAVRGFAVSLGSNNTFSNFQFPVTAVVNPFRLAGMRNRTDGFGRRLVLSDVTVAWAPLVLSQQPASTSGGMGLSADHSQTGTISFNLALVGTKDIDDFGSEMSALLGTLLVQAINLYPDRTTPGLYASDRQADVAAYIDKAFRRFLNDKKAELSGQFKLKTRFSYGWDARADHPDSVSLGLTAERGGIGCREPGQTAPHPITLSAGATQAWYQQDKSLQKANGALGASVVIRKGLTFAVQGSVDRYWGDGFKGISGARDSTDHTDFGLAQVFTFDLAGTDKLTFSVKEVHLGNGTDVTVNANFGVGVIH